MRRLTIAIWILLGAGCGGAPAARPPAAPTAAVEWPVPDGWKREEIPFPFDFAPSLAHQGVEELRFPPGFLDVSSPNRWSYTFEWRLSDAAELDAAGVGAELTAYFRGLLVAVDARKLLDPSQITATAVARGAGFAVTARIIDTFRDGAAIDLEGTAVRTACGADRVVWRFVLAPARSPIRAQLDALAAHAPCGR